MAKLEAAGSKYALEVIPQSEETLSPTSSRPNAAANHEYPSPTILPFFE